MYLTVVDHFICLCIVTVSAIVCLSVSLCLYFTFSFALAFYLYSPVSLSLSVTLCLSYLLLLPLSLFLLLSPSFTQFFIPTHVLYSTFLFDHDLYERNMRSVLSLRPSMSCFFFLSLPIRIHLSVVNVSSQEVIEVVGLFLI